MPFGAPFHTVPKSGWRPRSSPPQLASSVDDAGSTGSPDTSRFHGLSAGKGGCPAVLGGGARAAEVGVRPGRPGFAPPSAPAATIVRSSASGSRDAGAAAGAGGED